MLPWGGGHLCLCEAQEGRPAAQAACRLVALLFPIRYGYAMAIVGVGEAARRLEVSPRRVRQMISAGQLPACRVGRVWAVSESDLAAAARRAPRRPWKPSSAWAVIAAAEGAPLSALAAYERHRAFKRLKEGLLNVVGSLSERCQRRTFYAHPADVERIVVAAGVVRTAASAADEHGIDLVGRGPAEVYVAEPVFDQIIAGFHLEERSERPNLVLRVVAAEDWPFPEGAEVASRAVAAIDLLDSADDRARRAGAEMLEAL